MKMESRLFLFVLLTRWTPAFSAENDTNIESLLDSGNTRNPLLRASVGEYCWGEICSEHQYCNELFTCQCCPGYKSYDEFCVPCSGENERCETTADCCGMLLCINGICRKTVTNVEFVTLSKICLAVTATAIFVAIFSLLIKCLVRYGRFSSFRQGNVAADSNSVHDYMRQFMGPRPPPYDMGQEKPPSYEECIRATPRTEYPDPPPPYFVPVNVSRIEVSNNNVSNNNMQSPAAPGTDHQPSAATVLNVQSLAQPINFNLPQTQDIKSEGNVRKVEETHPAQHI